MSRDVFTCKLSGRSSENSEASRSLDPSSRMDCPAHRAWKHESQSHHRREQVDERSADQDARGMKEPAEMVHLESWQLWWRWRELRRVVENTGSSLGEQCTANGGTSTGRHELGSTSGELQKRSDPSIAIENPRSEGLTKKDHLVDDLRCRKQRAKKSTAGRG